MKPLLVGELNPYGSESRYALFPYPANSTGDRLCKKIMGLTRVQYVRSFNRINLCTGKWDREAAESAAYAIKYDESLETVVLLGAKVCAAFGFPYAPFSIMLSKGKTFVILPHPSGLCRTWNEPDAFARAKRLLKKYAVLPRVIGRKS